MIKARFVFPAGTYKTIEVNDDVKCFEHFTFGEIANLSAMDDIKLRMDYKFLTFGNMIEEFRTWYNKPMKVNSWFRTASFNTSCGGDKSSAHLLGCAMDWGINNLTDDKRKVYAAKWEQICKAHGIVGAINYYTHGIHFEAYSDVCYGNTKFVIRSYIGKKGDW